MQMKNCEVEVKDTLIGVLLDLSGMDTYNLYYN